MRHPPRLLISTCLLFASAVAALSQSYGDRVPWHTPRVTFTWQQSSVRDVLKDFAVSQQLVLSMSASVKGVVSGVFEDVDAEKFLNSICEAHDLIWFYDGVRLNVESASEIISRPLTLSYVTPEAINDALYTLGFASGPRGREVQVKTRYRAGVILLVGGPQFIQGAEALVRDLDTQEAKRQVEEITIKTFRLSYASASDVSLNSGNSTRVIPGVVRTLQNLMANQQNGSSLSTGAESETGRKTHQSLLGQGMVAVGNPNPPSNRTGLPYGAESAPAPRPGSRLAQQQENQQNPDRDPRSPMIVADTRLNAVIVRDVIGRMPLYENLIRMLDVPTKSIEISAAVVDIDSNNGKELGLEILGFGKKGDNIGRVGFNADRGIFDATDIQGKTASFFDSSNLARGAGLNVTALLSGAGYEMLSRLKAIEQAGVGQVLSSPSVLTMENVQAVIRTDEKVYVKVPGSYATDLFDVTTGVQLRVTPTIVNRGHGTEYKLDIEIVDGNFTDLKVDTIPTTIESSITTQAMVPESKTLLLGGYTVERRQKQEAKVPYVSKIPILGKLFSDTKVNHERRQRFFLITPRLVNVHKETTYPSQYDPKARNFRELTPELPEPDLTRENPEELARILAASTARVPPPPPPRATPAPAVRTQKVIDTKQTKKPSAQTAAPTPEKLPAPFPTTRLSVDIRQ